MYQGKIIYLAAVERGFGFIQSEDFESTLFFHARDLKKISFEELKKGDDVSFVDVKEGEKGKSAIGVCLS